MTDLYAGLTALNLGKSETPLGYGIVLRPIYAHLFASPMVAFSRAAPDKPHPGPWKSVDAGISHEITAELFIPEETTKLFQKASDIAHAIAFTMRLGVHPGISLAVLSNRPLTAGIQSTDKEAWITSVELEPRRLLLSTNNLAPEEESASWVAERWPTLLKFSKESAEFALAVDALNIGQYLHRPALTIISLWAALEALFSPSTSELKFRVSSHIAAYLEPPGVLRKKRAKDIAKLYDKRSAAAHGRPSHDTTQLVDTFNVLREVLIRILDEKRLFTKDELESLLYGAVIHE